jgi:hypothetical protein
LQTNLRQPGSGNFQNINILLLEPIPEIYQNSENQNEWNRFHKENLSEWEKDLGSGPGLCWRYFGPEELNYQTLFRFFEEQWNFGKEIPEASLFRLDILPYYAREESDLTQEFLLLWTELTKSFPSAKNLKTSSDSVQKNTAIYFSKVWTTHYLKNLLAHSVTEKNTKSLNSPHKTDKIRILEKDGFKNSPKTAVFLGAAPRMESDLEWIIGNRAKLFLICSDTCSRFILNSGIVPDLILSIDAGRGTLFHLYPNQNINVPLVTWLGADPVLSEEYSNRYFFLSSHPLDQIISLKWDLPPSWCISNPSKNLVGMAKNLAVYLGFQNFLAAGFSLVSEHGKTHCRGTGYEIYYLNQINRRTSFYQKMPTHVYQKTLTSKNKEAREHTSEIRVLDEVKLTQPIETIELPIPEVLPGPVDGSLPHRLFDSVSGGYLKEVYDLFLRELGMENSAENLYPGKYPDEQDRKKLDRISQEKLGTSLETVRKYSRVFG